jgi:hypothetical protein
MQKSTLKKNWIYSILTLLVLGGVAFVTAKNLAASPDVHSVQQTKQHLSQNEPTDFFLRFPMTSGITLDSKSDTVASSLTDVNHHSATQSNTLWAPRYDQFGANGKPGIIYNGMGGTVSNFDSSTLSIAQNVSGITAFQVVKPDAYDSSQTTGVPSLFISTNNGPATTRFAAGFTGTNALYIAARRLDDNHTQTANSPANIYTPGETFVMAQKVDYKGDGQNATFTIYKNKKQVYTGSTSLGSGPTSNTPSLAAYLGGVGTNNIYVKSTIGEVVVFPRALTPDEITAQVSAMMARANITNIQVTSPTNYQSFQRSLTTNTANIPISGTYTGTPSAVEASFNGGAYQTIEASPTGSKFSGILKHQAAGQGILTVRFKNHSTQTCKKYRILVGDIFVLTGQSNQTDVLDPRYIIQTAKTYSMPKTMGPTVFNSRYAFGKWFDANHMQMWIVPFAQQYYKTHGYPCGFILAAIGGTNSTKWRADNSVYFYKGEQTGDNFGMGLNLYNRSKAMIIAALGSGVSPTAIFHGQGEADSGGLVSQETYLSNISNTFAQYHADFPGTRIVPSLVQVIKDNNGRDIPTTNVNNAIKQAWSTLPYVSPGVNLSAITSDAQLMVLHGSFHMLSDDNVTAQANAWMKGLNAIDCNPKRSGGQQSAYCKGKN